MMRAAASHIFVINAGEEEYPRPGRFGNGKRFRSHPHGAVSVQGPFAQLVHHCLPCQVHAFLRIDSHREVLVLHHFHRAAVKGSGILRDLQKGLAESQTVFVFRAAGGAGKHELFRNNIRFMTGFHGTERIGEAVRRRRDPHAVGTELGSNGNKAFNGAHRHIGAGTVAAFSMKLDAEKIGSCHGSAVKDAYLSCRQIPFHMGAKAGIHMDMMVP